MATHTDHTKQHPTDTSPGTHAGHDTSGHDDHTAPPAAGHEGHSMPAGGPDGHAMGQGGHDATS